MLRERERGRGEAGAGYGMVTRLRERVPGPERGGLGLSPGGQWGCGLWTRGSVLATTQSLIIYTNSLESVLNNGCLFMLILYIYFLSRI